MLLDDGVTLDRVRVLLLVGIDSLSVLEATDEPPVMTVPVMGIGVVMRLVDELLPLLWPD